MLLFCSTHSTRPTPRQHVAHDVVDDPERAPPYVILLQLCFVRFTHTFPFTDLSTHGDALPSIKPIPENTGFRQMFASDVTVLTNRDGTAMTEADALGQLLCLHPTGEQRRQKVLAAFGQCATQNVTISEFFDGVCSDEENCADVYDDDANFDTDASDDACALNHQLPSIVPFGRMRCKRKKKAPTENARRTLATKKAKLTLLTLLPASDEDLSDTDVDTSPATHMRVHSDDQDQGMSDTEDENALRNGDSIKKVN